VVKAESKDYPADRGQRNVVPRHLNLLKSVVPFELSQTVGLLFSVRHVRVPEIRDRSFGARFYGLGQQRIGRSLVPVPDHGENMHQACLASVLVSHQLNEANQASLEVCADKNTSI